MDGVPYYANGFFSICIAIWGRIYFATAGNKPVLNFVKGFEDMYITSW